MRIQLTIRVYNYSIYLSTPIKNDQILSGHFVSIPYFNLALVRGPTIPSALSPFAFWKAIVACFVFGPNIPSTLEVSGKYFLSFRQVCKLLTSVPFIFNLRLLEIEKFGQLIFIVLEPLVLTVEPPDGDGDGVESAE